MQTQEKFIELRTCYPGSCVSVLGPGCLTGDFRKLENQFFHRYDRLPDGSEQSVYLLPNHDLTYEVEEVADGTRIRWYCATLERSPNIYRISLEGAKVYARREMVLRDVVREYPERRPLSDYRDEEE